MYRVIIVDDEAFIRKGLRETIEWGSLGLEVSGEAGNGVEALALIRDFKPQIVITDIKMPKMDGIALLKEAKRISPNIKFIILSGYSDYAILKDAIRFGVQSYLLKPIDNDELISNLLDAVNSVKREIYLNIQQHQGEQLLKTSILNRLVTNGIGVREFEEKAAFLNISLAAEQYVCAVYLADIADDVFEGDKQLALVAVHNICEELTRETGLTFIGDKGELVFLFAGENADALRGTVNTVLCDVASRVQACLGIYMLIGVGEMVSAAGELWKSYNASVRCLEYSVFVKDTHIIWYDQIGLTSQAGREIQINHDLIRNLMKSGDKDKFLLYMEEVFQGLSSATANSVEYIRNSMIWLVVEIMGIHRELNEKTAHKSVVDYDYTDLLKIRRIEGFWHWFNQYCERIFAVSGKYAIKTDKMANQIIAYVREHYHESINLKQIAEVLQMNPSYIGQTFKRATGESFSDYLNRFRIEKAKSILADSNLKVYEVADKVGYKDYRYFLRTFKKITGMNPTDAITRTIAPP